MQDLRNRRPNQIEQLEMRRLLCGLPHDFLGPAPPWSPAVEQQAASQTESPDAVSIEWINRNTFNDTDPLDNKFDNTFGNRAADAIAVVDAAIDHWERIITSWNRSDGTISLQITIFSFGQSFGGAAAPGLVAPADGKPRTGTFTLGGGNLSPDLNDANGWYLDPNPDDHAEFNGPIINPYAGSTIGPGAPDFYSVAIAELTHLLGLISDVNNQGGNFQGYRLESNGSSPTGMPDAAEGVGTFWIFDGPTIDHLMTSVSGGADWGNIAHSASPADFSGNPITINFAGRTWQGSASAGNARVNASRMIPDFAMAHVLADAYGYSIREPWEFDTFHYVLNRDTGELLIRGGRANTSSDDVITIGRSGSDITLSVDVGADVPGTGALPGPGNLPAFTASFPSSQVTSITIAAMDGDDIINIDGAFAGIPMLVDGGFDNDTVNLAPAGDNLDLINGMLTVQGNTGTNTLILHDTNNGFDDTFTITQTTIDRQVIPPIIYGGFQVLRIDAGAGSATFNVNSLLNTTDLTLHAGGGNDVINIGPGGGNADAVDGTIHVFGQNNSDTLNWNDSTSTSSGTYTLTSNSISRPGAGSLFYGTTETIVLNAASGANTINVNSTANGSSATVNAGGGADTINVGLSAAAALAVNGGAANDIVSLNNPGGLSGIVVLNGNASTAPGDVLNYNAQNSSANDTWEINSGSIERDGSVQVFHGTFEHVAINAGVGNDTFDVESTIAGTTTTINANIGTDALNVTLGSGNLGTSDGSIAFNGEAGSDTATLWDNLSTANDSYTVAGAQITRPGFGGITWGTTEGVALNCSSGGNEVDINSTLPGTPVTINGLNGSDVFTVATGDFDNQILANVVLNGGIGADLILLSDISDGLGSDIYTFQNNSVSKLTSGVVSWNGVETVQINGSNNADLYDLISNTAGTTIIIDANNGNDLFQIGAIAGGNLANLPGPITINGMGGSNDSVVVTDSGSSQIDNYSINPTALTHPGFGGLTYGSVESLTLHASTGANVIDVNGTNSATPIVLNANGGTDTLNIHETSAIALATISPSSGSDIVRVNNDGLGFAGALFNATQRIGPLTVGSGGRATVAAGGDKVLTVGSIAFGITGQLNLADNDMIVDYTGASPLAAIQSLVMTGYAAGAWTGSGINSSTAAGVANTAIGIAEATDLFSTFPAPFSGQPIDSSSILLKYTFYGDTNLDGNVNLSDFNRLAANFGQASRRWVHGDNDYNGNVNLSDFNRLAANFGLASVPDGQDEMPAAGKRPVLEELE
jgi:hypothetical protein